MKAPWRIHGRVGGLPGGRPLRPGPAGPVGLDSAPIDQLHSVLASDIEYCHRLDRGTNHAIRVSPGLDATVLTGGDYSPVIYVGDYQSDVTRQVVGAGNPAQDSWVFPSGSWSGASVVQVTLVNQYVNLDGQTVGPGFFTEHPNRVASVGKGDSGGPVAQGTAAITTVNARGMISAIDRNTEGPCQGLVTSGRVCGWRAYHVNITQIANALNFTVMTS